MTMTMTRATLPRTSEPTPRAAALATVAASTILVAAVGAAELKPRTVAAFDRYVALTEARMQAEVDGDAPFLRVDRLEPAERADAYARLREGEVVIERLETRDGSDDVDVPDGKIHHWLGTVMLPGVALDDVLALVQDYDRYAEVYRPDVQASRVLSRDGSRFRVYLQLYRKKVVTVVLNTEYDVEYRLLGDGRAYVPSYTTRIVELENPGTPEEVEKPEGQDRGFMWRFYNYCSFAERDDGTYMQCESLVLTRGIPFLLNLIVRPFVTGVPREALTFTLEATRQELVG